MPQPIIAKVADDVAHRNFQEIAKVIKDADHVLRATLTPVLALVTGDNAVTLPRDIPNPTGCHRVFVDAAVTLFDKGLSGGKWILNASGPCNVRLMFF